MDYEYDIGDEKIKITIKLINDNYNSEELKKLCKKLKLIKLESLNNFTLWDTTKKIKRYSSIKMYIEEWYNWRLDKYRLRKSKQIKYLEKILKVLSNKAKFITGIINNTIKFVHDTKTELNINKLLESKKFDKIENSYQYLLGMKIYSFSKEKVDKINKEVKEKKRNLKFLKEKSVKKIWLEELEILNKFIKDEKLLTKSYFVD